MDREHLLKIWDQAWTEGLWYAPWSKVIEDLTPEQATWRPQPGRHCIWEHVGHMLFWREVALRRTRGESIDQQEVDRRNFKPPSSATADAWNAMHGQFEQSHQTVRAAIADPSSNLERLAYVPYHDSYHVGQIMLLRALQGLAPIE